MNLPVVALGAGGHARVLIDTLQSLTKEILGVATANYRELGPLLMNVPIIGDDNMVFQLYSPDQIEVVNGIGSVKSIDLRKSIYEVFKLKGYRFCSVIHPSAVLSKKIELSEGIQVMAGAVIQVGSKIGENVIINTKASVDHDCFIGHHVHLAPGVTLSGGVEVGDEVHIGTGATVIQGINIGRNVLVAAGSVVTKDLPPNVVAMGVPARIVQTRC